MTQHDKSVRLRHMLEYARIAHNMTLNRAREELDTDTMFRLALARAVEVIGEAADRVLPEIRASYPAIPWQQIIRTRHRLVHAYDLINLDILWEIATVDVPPLITQLEIVLKETGA